MNQIINYPHITSNPKILSRIPIVEETRTPVRSIAGYFKMGMNPDEILFVLPYLTPAQVFAALAYYFDYKSKIVADIVDNNDTAKWMAFAESAQRPA